MKKKGREIYPDEVLIDSSNLPNFDTDQLEGRLEKPISRAALYAVGGSFVLLALVFLGQALNLDVVHGGEYLTKSQNNLLRPVPIFSSRGEILDRNSVPLAWNAPAEAPATGTPSGFVEDSVPQREYATTTGLSHVLGYVQYPSKDKNGFYYQNDFEGVDGVEKYYNDRLTGENGSRLVEVDAHGDVISQNVVKPPQAGETVKLSIDSRVQSALYQNIRAIASEYGFTGGAGVIMDVKTGEILAMTSYPEYGSQVMSDKTDQNAIRAALANKNLPFLDRAVGGLYTPGSIVKPYVAMGVLNENIISPTDVIVTTGSISVPNPYDPKVMNVFRDWSDLGPLDLYHAIAMSSDAYFYTVGGGYKDQKGLGIANIDKYLAMFGLGEAIPDSFTTGPSGLVSSPAWKQATFNEPWFLGDTYHTVIGQYGTQVTPVQIVRAMGAIANEGTLLVPTILAGDGPHVERTIDLPKADFDVVHKGMRLGVEIGTSGALNEPFVAVAGKSGTAELGVSKASVNSWITGFWPYSDPHYAFAVTLEHGSVHNLIGAAAAMKAELEWMDANTPEYFK
ncbi:MAG: penicillin-binding transpeptidase domain-containing protein [Minisyncoccia bacterium]|jgi:penicillin-binding protein 2